ncbi:MAG: hypothetical protein EAZ97_08965 [Bacteroidetes bacterium]|nr:MAG: hypothetical protein EAZ97_08965 [Bacteroidota bacterium]
MKNLKVSIFFLLFLMVGTSVSFAQDCDSELYSNISLKKLNDGYTFIKSFKIDGKGGQRKDIEYTCVFSKDTKYRIIMQSKDDAATGIVATLFDAKRVELATSFQANKFYEGWIYVCKATGIYYLRFSFKDSNSYCGGAVLGFKR